MTYKAKVDLSDADRKAWRVALLVAAAATAARIFWLAFGGTQLYPDEAQYWIWSLHPTFGYYSKPPLVAWIIWLTTRWGDSEFAVRLGAPLLHGATALVLYATARRLYDARVALWSSILYITLPAVSVLAIVISTDSPLLFFWTVALYAFVRAREPGGERWWIAVGAAAGFGLLSKYAMAYWLMSALLYLLVMRDERRRLPFFLAASVLALLIYSPNFFWNLSHGLVSYRHTDANADLHGPLLHPNHFLEFFSSQFLVFGPLLFATLIVMALRPRRSLTGAREIMLACFAAPPLALMLLLSFLSRAQPNWAAPTYVSATILVTAWLLAQGWRWILVASLALHVFAAAAVLGAHDVAAALGTRLPARYDPLRRLRGWRSLGETVEHMVAAQDPKAHLMTDDHGTAAALVYYTRRFDVLKWNGDDPGGVHDQFDLDAKPDQYLGQDFLLVSRNPDPVGILQRFDQAGPPQPLDIASGGPDRRYTIFLLRGFKGYR